MPMTISDLMKHIADSQHSEESPADVYRNAVAGLLAPTFQQIQRTLSTADVMRSSSVMLAEGERIRREAEARQATIQARDLAVQEAEELRRVREELRRVREESKVEARKTRLYFWWGIAATAIATALGWLVAH